MLSGLKECGLKLGIATGRPSFELLAPLKKWDALKYFEGDMVIDYDFVTRAQDSLSSKRGPVTLSKPHPYMFLKSLFGKDYPDEKIVDGIYDKARIEKALIVGDAGSDILASKAMGAKFLAVLTGVNGKNARGYFEDLKSDYIFDSILDFLE